MDIRDYISITRPDHWFKNFLILPGVVIAMMLTQPPLTTLWLPLLLGFFSTCAIASANYVVNEWLDSETDKFHPIKKSRPFVRGGMNIRLVLLEFLLLAATGLYMASLISSYFLLCALFLFLMGIIYNVKPFRTKDRVYLDVLTESINSPIRLLLGWFIVTKTIIPPASFIVAYWMAGAFLMNTKRLAELRFIAIPEVMVRYRKSFKYYTEAKLLLMSFFYSMCSAFFLGIFLIKHRIELLLSLPFLAVLFTWYLHIGMKPDSSAQKPEKLYREKLFILYLICLLILMTALLFVDLPWLHFLTENTFINSKG